MVVQVLKAERGRPDKLRADGERKPGMEGRRGKEGRRWEKGVGGWRGFSRSGEREVEVWVRVVRRRRGRVLALLALFFNFDARRTVAVGWSCTRSSPSLSRSLSAAFSASISACHTSSLLSVASAGVDTFIEPDKMLMEVTGLPGNAGDRWDWDVGDKGADVHVLVLG